MELIEDTLYEGLIISGNKDGTINLWNYKSGKIASLYGHTDEIKQIIRLTDTIIMSLSKDKTMKLWDLTTKTCKQTIKTNYELKTILKLNDNTIVSLCEDGQINYWDINTGESTQEFYNFENYNFSHLKLFKLDDSSFLCVGMKVAKIWNLFDNEKNKTLFEIPFETEENCQNALQISPDEILCLHLNDEMSESSTSLWNIHTGKCTKFPVDMDFSGSIIKLETNLIVTCCWDTSIKIVDYENGKVKHRFKSNDKMSTTNLVLLNKDYIASSRGSLIEIWSLNKEDPVKGFTSDSGTVTCLII